MANLARENQDQKAVINRLIAENNKLDQERKNLTEQILSGYRAWEAIQQRLLNTARIFFSKLSEEDKKLFQRGFDKVCVEATIGGLEELNANQIAVKFGWEPHYALELFQEIIKEGNFDVRSSNGEQQIEVIATQEDLKKAIEERRKNDQASQGN